MQEVSLILADIFAVRIICLSVPLGSFEIKKATAINMLKKTLLKVVSSGGKILLSIKELLLNFFLVLSFLSRAKFFLRIKGTFTNFEIDIALDSSKEIEFFNITIDAAGVIGKNGKTDLLLKENFFDAQKYEQITLESESVENLSNVSWVTGELNIKDNVHKVILKLYKKKIATTRSFEDAYIFSGKLLLNPEDFELNRIQKSHLKKLEFFPFWLPIFIMHLTTTLSSFGFFFKIFFSTLFFLRKIPFNLFTCSLHHSRVFGRIFFTRSYPHQHL